MQLSKNFNSIKDHMQCPCCNAFEYDPKFLLKLQLLRELVGESFFFDKKGGGFYRCAIYQHNLDDKRKAKSPRSMHKFGKAADILTHGWSGVTKRKFVEEAIRLGFSIGIYSHHIHVDLRDFQGVLWSGSYS